MNSLENKNTIFSGNFNNDTLDSVFYWNLNNTTSNSNGNIGSRLTTLNSSNKSMYLPYHCQNIVPIHSPLALAKIQS